MSRDPLFDWVENLRAQVRLEAAKLVDALANGAKVDCRFRLVEAASTEGIRDLFVREPCKQIPHPARLFKFDVSQLSLGAPALHMKRNLAVAHALNELLSGKFFSDAFRTRGQFSY